MNVREHFRRLFGLRNAFRRTFLGENGIPHPDAAVVLGELRRFCYGEKPTIKTGPQGIDPFASVAAAARQEVWMRVQAMLNLDDRALAAMERRATEGERDDG